MKSYIAAIDRQDYSEAWAIGGKNTGGSFATFTNGFSGTAYDRLTIISTSGDRVTAALAGYQSNGTLDSYREIYTVVNSNIVDFHLVAESASVTSVHPQAVVEEYFAAIDRRDYSEAWAIGGRNTGTPFSVFASDLSTTAYDRLVVISVSGNKVTARLVAYQTYGAVKIYYGLYTVIGSVIALFDVRQVG